MEDFTRFLYVNDLLAYYGGFLTEKQLDIMKQYYHLNLSLQEIAENLAISRAAVSDTMKKALQHLENFEANLGLIKKTKHLKELVENLKNTTLTIEQAQLVKSIEEEL